MNRSANRRKRWRLLGKRLFQTEREGFEPSYGENPVTGFRDRCKRAESLVFSGVSVWGERIREWRAILK